jgi:hypothetical protein
LALLSHAKDGGMNVWCLSFITLVFLLTAGQLSSYQSQVRHLSLKILDLFLDVGQEMVDLLNGNREPQRSPMRGVPVSCIVNQISR